MRGWGEAPLLQPIKRIGRIVTLVMTVTVEISRCARCGGVIPPSAPMGLCKRCFRLSTGLPEAEWERQTELEAPRMSGPSDLPKFTAGQKFGNGRYVLKQRLGQGGMGDVWLAKDLQLAKPVALKFLAEQLHRDPRGLRLLRDEVVLSQELSHPNVLRIYDWNEHTGEPVFVAMEYVDGGTLEERLAEQPGGYFSWLVLAPFAKQLCDGLKYAHDRKVIHRDIKPRNLLVTRRNVLKLADFGLAKFVKSGELGKGDHTSGAGTIAYMSPQQRVGAAATVADDIYALGATLYELLTGFPPPALSPRQPVKADTWPKAKPVREVVAQRGPSDVPKPVQEAIAACLEFERARRPANVYQLAQRMGLEQSDWAEASGAVPRQTKVDRRRVWKPILMVGGVALLLCLLVIKTLEHRENKLQGSSLGQATNAVPDQTSTVPSVQLAESPPPKLEPIRESPLPEPPLIGSNTIPVTAVETNQPPAALPPKPVMPPAIRVHPKGQPAHEGESVVLEAEADGEPPFAFRWYQDGQLLHEATNSRLVFVASLKKPYSEFAVAVWNAGGGVTSMVARVDFLPILPEVGRRWTNSLGIPFVPLGNSALLVAAWETRVRDFSRMPPTRLKRQFARSKFQKHEEEPVVEVAWGEATNYCAWLTEEERRKGRLGTSHAYRLPTDQEWSRLAELPEEKGTTPRERFQGWTPPGHDRLVTDRRRPHWNVAGAERKSVPALANQPAVPGHDDGIPYTGDVRSANPDAAGLHHLFGNASEWCGDTLGDVRFHRGASWQTAETRELSPAWRFEAKPYIPMKNVGFRLVLDLTPRQ